MKHEPLRAIATCVCLLVAVAGCDRKPRLVPASADSLAVSGQDSIAVLSRQASQFAFPPTQQPNVHKCGFLGKHPDQILGQRERNRQQRQSKPLGRSRKMVGQRHDAQYAPRVRRRPVMRHQWHLAGALALQNGKIRGRADNVMIIQFCQRSRRRMQRPRRRTPFSGAASSVRGRSRARSQSARPAAMRRPCRYSGLPETSSAR